MVLPPPWPELANKSGQPDKLAGAGVVGILLKIRPNECLIFIKSPRFKGWGDPVFKSKMVTVTYKVTVTGQISIC
jgi:hypothetical protein